MMTFNSDDVTINQFVFIKLINRYIIRIKSHHYQYHEYQLARTKSLAKGHCVTLMHVADHNLQKKYSWYTSIKSTFRDNLQCFADMNGI